MSDQRKARSSRVPARGTSSTNQRPGLKAGAKDSPLTIGDLGWTRAKTAEIRASLLAFEEDWNAPGMEAYDRL